MHVVCNWQMAVIIVLGCKSAC